MSLASGLIYETLTLTLCLSSYVTPKNSHESGELLTLRPSSIIGLTVPPGGTALALSINGSTAMRLTTLKLCRFGRGVMQTVLAKRVDIPFGRLSAIENGDADPLPEELARIAEALNVPVKELLPDQAA